MVTSSLVQWITILFLYVCCDWACSKFKCSGLFSSVTSVFPFGFKLLTIQKFISLLWKFDRKWSIWFTEPGTICFESKSNAVNLLFAMDGSTSVEPQNYAQQKNFIKSIVDGLVIGRFSVGLLQWASSARVEFPIQKGRTKAQIKGLINKVNQIKGSTYTDLVFSNANRIFKGLTYVDRKKDQNVLIVMTDGVSVYPDYLTNALNTYKKEAVVTTTTYAVGIDKASLQELKKMASSNDKAFYSNKFTGLPNFVDKISKASNTISCGGS